LALFVALAARPSASWHVGVRPTDALGARRYEEGDTPSLIVGKIRAFRSGSRPSRLLYDQLPIGVIPAKAGIQWWNRRRMLSVQPRMPAFAGMTSLDARLRGHDVEWET